MPRWRSRKTIIVASLAVAVVVTGGVTFSLLYTPTITLRIQNDTPQQVTLAGCASDPATLDPGQTGVIDPNANDPHAACIVYQGESREVLGCLYIPTTRYRNNSTVRVSLFKRGVAPGHC